MVSSSSQSVFKFNNEAFKSKIYSEMHVDFNITRDRESVKILRLIEASGLKVFCSKRSSQNKTLDMLGIEFYVNGTFSETSIETKVHISHHLSITKTSLAYIFETNEEGVHPLVYKEDS